MVGHIRFTERIFRSIDDRNENARVIRSTQLQRESNVFYDKPHKVAFTTENATSYTHVSAISGGICFLIPDMVPPIVHPGYLNFYFVDIDARNGFLKYGIPRKKTTRGGVGDLDYDYELLGYRYVGFLFAYAVGVEAPTPATVQFLRAGRHRNPLLSTQNFDPLAEYKVKFFSDRPNIYQVKLSFAGYPTYIRHLVYSDNEDQFNEVFDELEVGRP